VTFVTHLENSEWLRWVQLSWGFQLKSRSEYRLLGFFERCTECRNSKSTKPLSLPS